MEYLKNPKFIGAVIALIAAIALVKIVPAVFMTDNTIKKNDFSSGKTYKDSDVSGKNSSGLFSQKGKNGRQLTPEERKENERQTPGYGSTEVTTEYSFPEYWCMEAPAETRTPFTGQAPKATETVRGTAPIPVLVRDEL